MVSLSVTEAPPVEPENVEDLLEPDIKKELPRHLSITKDVMERCIHLLSDPSLRLRLKVLLSSVKNRIGFIYSNLTENSSPQTY